jgi:hypothetical protein
MKNNYLIIGILLIIAMAISVIFFSGEKIREKSQNSYCLVYFENTTDDNFNVTVENFENNANDYELVYFIDNQEVAKIKETVQPRKKKTVISPSDVSSIINKKTAEKITVKVAWKDETQEIWKYFNKNNK